MISLSIIFTVIISIVNIGCVQTSIDKPTKPLNVDKAVPFQVRGFNSCPLSEEDIDLLIAIKKGIVEPDIVVSEKGLLALSPKDMNAWRNILRLTKDYFPPLVINSDNSKPIFMAIFDGTWNDREATGEARTVPGILSYELEKLAVENAKLHVKYYHGVGTRVSFFSTISEGITGEGTVERAEQALIDLQQIADEIGEMPHVYAIGFSRGAASARHFLNLVDPMINLPANIGTLDFNRSRSFALLFDTVATGQLDNLLLGIPVSTISVLHLVATKERRLNFPFVTVLSDIDNGQSYNTVLEVELPGAHSDIGGGYGYGLETISFNMAMHWLVQQGFELNPIRIDALAIMNNGAHNSDWLFTPIGNKLLHIFGKEEHRRIESVDILSKDLTADQTLALTFENSVSKICSAKDNYKRLLDKNRSGMNIIEKSLNFNFSRNGESLVIKTNCPNFISFEPTKMMLLLNGTEYLSLNEMYNDLETTPGYIYIVPPENPSNFRYIKPSP